jgi:O-antigen ligase
MGRTLKETLLFVGISAFCVSLFLPDMPVAANAVIALLFIHCFSFDAIKARRLILLDRPMLLFLLLFYAMQMLSAALSVDHHEAIKLLVRRCPLAVFPLCIGSIYIRPHLYRRILLGYAVITTLAALVFFAASLLRVWRMDDIQWLYDDSLTRWMNRPSTYMAWMVTIALFCYFNAIRTLLFTRKQRIAVYMAMGFLLVFHYLLASRSSIIFLYSAILILAVYHTWRSRNRIAVSVLLSLPIAAIALVFLFPKTVNRFRELQYTGYDFHSEGVESHYNMPVTKDQWNGANIRLAIWHCGMDLARRHWFAGVALGDKDSALQTQYEAEGFTFAYDHKRNLHNTYLDVLVNTGVPGLLVFALACVILPLIRAIRQKSSFAIVVTAAVAMAIFTENWLDQSQGCLLLGFWLSFISAGYPPLSRVYNLTASSVSPKKTRWPWAI